MRRVGIKVLKNRLSEFVRAVEAGDTVLVTDRNRVVAELVPPRRASAKSEDEILAMAIREGWMTPARISHTEPLPDFAPPPPDEIVVTFDQLMVDLAGDREDR